MGHPFGGNGQLRPFLRRVYDKAAEDNVFFLASGMTFGILVAAIPFLILLLSVAGLFLAPQFEAPQREVLNWFWELVPVESPQVRAEFESTVQDISQSAGSIGLVSGVLFVWFSTRLFGALRTVLGEVFDLGEGPGVIRGKLTDVLMVLVSTVLLCLNIALTSFLTGLGREGLLRAGLKPGTIQMALGLVAAFVFIYVMFLLIFKFVTLNRIPWRTAALAALVATGAFELLKAVFGWWVVNFADYSAVFFALSTLVVVVLSMYYGSLLFVLGGEIAQTAELGRTLRQQREIFEA